MSYDFESFNELVHARRSMRKLKSDPIPEDAIGKILECGRWAMNGGNAQPWEFIVVENKDTILKIAEIWAECFREFKPIEDSRVPELRHPVFSRPLDELPNWKDCPAMIGLIGDKRKMQTSVLHCGFYGAEGGDGMTATYYKDLGNAAQLMHLAVTALGLGSEWLSLESNVAIKIQQLLEIPFDLQLQSFVLIGYPDMTPPPGHRRPLEEIVHYEKYNMDLYSTTEDVRDMILDSRAAVRKAEAAAYEVKPVGE